MKIKLTCVVASCTVAFAIPALAAEPLPASVGLAFAEVFPSTGFGGSGAMNDGVPATASGSFMGGAAFASDQSVEPSVTSSAISKSNNIDADSNAVLEYYFEVSGPSNTFVPVSIKGGVSTSGSADFGNSGAVATELIHYVDTAAFSTAAQAGHPFFIGEQGCFGNTAAFCQPSSQSTPSAAFDEAISLLSNSPIEVFLEASVIVPNGDAHVSASADPFIQIEPDFADAKDFSLSFSDGIVNISASVPEPATWVLMLVGVGALGGTLRARRGRDNHRELSNSNVATIPKWSRSASM
jgi:hypothetical protein